MITVAIVAALNRELAPLVRDWQSRRFSYEGRTFLVHTHAELVAVAGGIGRAAATIAARALVAQYRPRLLISAGVAGALHPELKVGSVFIPRVVIDSSTSAQYQAEAGSGILVTAAQILNRTSKQVMAGKFKAAAVDMEAAAVAQVAREEHVAFRCVKAISDDSEFEMPPLNLFVDEQGQFRTPAFAFWAAFHPWQWPAILRLGRNTKRASKALGDWFGHAAFATGLGPQSADMAGKTTKVLDV